MKPFTILLFCLMLLFYACDKPVYEKPAELIKENQMINMLVDIHIAEAIHNTRGYSDSLMNNTSSEDFYYSVLAKYNVADSVFEKSFVFYASNPKNFEKMYRQVMNKLSEMEQESSGRNTEALEFGTEQ